MEAWTVAAITPFLVLSSCISFPVSLPPFSSSYFLRSFVTPLVPPHFPSFPIFSSSLLPPHLPVLSHLAVFSHLSCSFQPFFSQQSPVGLQSPRPLLIKLREIGCPRPNNPRGRQAGCLLPLSPSSTPLHYSQLYFAFFHLVFPSVPPLFLLSIHPFLSVMCLSLFSLSFAPKCCVFPSVSSFSAPSSTHPKWTSDLCLLLVSLLYLHSCPF